MSLGSQIGSSRTRQMYRYWDPDEPVELDRKSMCTFILTRKYSAGFALVRYKAKYFDDVGTVFRLDARSIKHWGIRIEIIENQYNKASKTAYQQSVLCPTCGHSYYPKEE